MGFCSFLEILECTTLQEGDLKKKSSLNLTVLVVSKCDNETPPLVIDTLLGTCVAKTAASYVFVWALIVGRSNVFFFFVLRIFEAPKRVVRSGGSFRKFHLVVLMISQKYWN